MAPLSQSTPAVPPTHSPILPQKPKQTHNSSTSNNNNHTLPSVSGGLPSSRSAPQPRLNPLASRFIPFDLLLPVYDSIDENMDGDSLDFDRWDSRVNDSVDDILTQEAVWLSFKSSDDHADPYDPCSCHDKPRGSCPEIKAYQVDRIARGLNSTDLTPNMDGLKEPLKFPSFPLDVWEWALRGYFDGDEILRGFRYGWDVSFTGQPEPRDAKWNLQGASLFEKDVQTYIDQELKFGALVGPFNESEFPFRVYCSPLNTVPKKNSLTRRTVVDCTQLDFGINSYIDAHMHRGKFWKLSLPNSQ